MLGKFILWLSAVMFTGYGLVSFFDPSVPAGYADLVISSGDAFAEIGAMYGGLQTGFGVFCLLAALRPAYYHAGLTLLVLCIGTLALGRLYSALIGVEAVGMYTWSALVYELFTAGVAAIALRKGN